MLRRVAPTAIVGGALVLVLTAYLAADTRTVERPMFNGNRLGWCANWNADCGEPAAQAWCVAQGFAGAEAFVRAPGVGEKSPTRLIATGAICDSAECDGFKEITCTLLDPVEPRGGETTANPPLPPPRGDDPPIEVKAEAAVPDPVAPTAELPPSPETVPTPVTAPEPTATPAASTVPEPPPAPEVVVEADADANAVSPQSATADPAATGATPVQPEPVPDEATEDDPGPPPPDTITLAAAGAPPLRPVLEVFAEPTFNGRRLDWCRGWKDLCGKATADEFCRLNGFVEALSFAPDTKIGAAEPTRQIASGLVCDHDGCDGFAEIACTK